MPLAADWIELSCSLDEKVLFAMDSQSLCEALQGDGVMGVLTASPTLAIVFAWVSMQVNTCDAT